MRNDHSRKTIAVSINAAWNIVNFRKGLIAGLRLQGYRVVALAPDDRFSAQLEALGVDYIPIEMDRKGLSPARDLLLLWRYFRILRRLRPAAYLGYTAKPNIYGSIAAHWLAIPVINNVAGLGTAFIKQGLLTRIVVALYKVAFRRSATVFFQNPDDHHLFVSSGIVRDCQARLLPGSGIDLTSFVPSAVSSSDEGFKFLLIGRLLRDKGVQEFVEAARLVRVAGHEAQFQLLGFLDAANRTAIAKSDVESWITEGVIEYLGEAEDVRPFIQAADCVVLPSYREGLPRVLLEGAALAKPLIATDVPGCRHVVEDGKNGFLCSVRDARSLADAMIKMLRLSRIERQALGLAGRRKVELEFDENLVVQQYLHVISRAIQA